MPPNQLWDAETDVQDHVLALADTLAPVAAKMLAKAANTPAVDHVKIVAAAPASIRHTNYISYAWLLTTIMRRIPP